VAVDALLLERLDEAFGDAVALGLGDEGEALGDAPSFVCMKGNKQYGRLETPQLGQSKLSRWSDGGERLYVGQSTYCCKT
jgi:hypothetical protein